MFTVLSVIENLKSKLDAEITDYYDTKYIPAIESALNHTMQIFELLKENNKSINEALFELRKCFIYQTDKYSRISIDVDKMSIDSVNPLPKTSPKFTKEGNGNESINRTEDYEYIESRFFCSRNTKEEYELNYSNPFANGNGINKLCSELNQDIDDKYNVSFSYLEEIGYNNSSNTLIEIRPKIPQQPVAIFVTMNHPKLIDSSSEILIHKKFFNFICLKSLQYISFEDGENDIYSLSENDIRTIKELIS